MVCSNLNKRNILNICLLCSEWLGLCLTPSEILLLVGSRHIRLPFTCSSKHNLPRECLGSGSTCERVGSGQEGDKGGVSGDRGRPLGKWPGVGGHDGGGEGLDALSRSDVCLLSSSQVLLLVCSWHIGPCRHSSKLDTTRQGLSCNKTVARRGLQLGIEGNRLEQKNSDILLLLP